MIGLDRSIEGVLRLAGTDLFVMCCKNNRKGEKPEIDAATRMYVKELFACLGSVSSSRTGTGTFFCTGQMWIINTSNLVCTCNKALLF